jgi:hypothetical protein
MKQHRPWTLHVLRVSSHELVAAKAIFWDSMSIQGPVWRVLNVMQRVKLLQSLVSDGQKSLVAISRGVVLHDTKVQVIFASDV